MGREDKTFPFFFQNVGHKYVTHTHEKITAQATHLKLVKFAPSAWHEVLLRNTYTKTSH